MLKALTQPRSLRSRLWLFFSVVGPGIITANADNDASGILGYSQAGAGYQYKLIWVLLLSVCALSIFQEICARMAAVTGKGLADLIREEYGVKITLFAMAALIVANFATTVSEFAGILASVQVFTPEAFRHSIRFFVLPLLATIVWLLISRGSYSKVERVLLTASSVYLLYIGSAVLSKPNWGQVFHDTLIPSFSHIGPIYTYVFMIINIIGTTITPWGQFYIQSSVRDKGLDVKKLTGIRMDVAVGAIFTYVIAFCIMVCCGSTLFTHGISLGDDPGKAAIALSPIAGNLAAAFFAIGLFNASCFGAVVVPLSTAYSVTEALGWESGMGRRIREAPLFVGVYTFIIFASALVVMLFPNHLANLIILPNIVGGILLPIILVLMLRLVNNRRLMGNYVNKPTFNIIAWVTTVVLIMLSIALLVSAIMQATGH